MVLRSPRQKEIRLTCLGMTGDDHWQTFASVILFFTENSFREFICLLDLGTIKLTLLLVIL